MNIKDLLFKLKQTTFAVWLILLLSAVGMTNVNAQSNLEIEIGDDSSTNGFLPYYTLYNYTLTQQIYTADEIGLAGIITALNFNYTGNQTSDLTNTIDVYLKHTSKSVFENGNDWESIESGDLCYSGTFLIDAAPGWKQIVLDTPFEYNGVDNLLICFDNNTGSWTNTRQWYAYSTDANRAMYVRSDDTDYDPFNAAQYGGTMQTVNNHIILEILNENYGFISASINPAGTGTVNGVGVYQLGETCTLTALPNPGCIFLNWTENGEVVSTELEFSFTVTGNRTFVANFQYPTFLADDFNDGEINPELWIATGDNVYEEDGLLKMDQNVTDQNVSLLSMPLSLGTDNKIVMERKFKVHRGSDYYYGGFAIEFNGDTGIHGVPLHGDSWDGSITNEWGIDYIGVVYGYTYWEDKFGIYVENGIGSEIQGTRLCDVIFDTWLTEKIVIDLTAGTFSYYLDNVFINTVDMPELTTLAVNYYTTIFRPWGWWTGHSHYMDYIAINPEPTTLTVTPNPIEMGHRPNGAWMQPLTVSIANLGAGAMINSLLATNGFFVIEETPDLPLNLAYGDSFSFDISTATGVGVINANLLVDYNEGEQVQFPLLATAYNPISPDVWELAQQVSSFPFTATLNTNSIPLYDNYHLPPTSIADGADAVYKLVFTEDTYLNANVTNGENGKVALYKESFNGIGGPDLDNYYTGPEMTIEDWLYYDNGEYATGIGASGNEFWWGIKLDVSAYAGTALTKVSVYDYAYMEGDVMIYQTDGTPYGEPALQQSISLTGSSQFVEFVLNTPYNIDDSQALWIVMHYISGDSWPAAASNNTGDPNGRWVSLDNSDWQDLEYYGLSYTWMLRGYVTNSNGRTVALGDRNEVQNLTVTPGTYYLAASSTSNEWTVEINAEEMPCPEVAYNPIPANDATEVVPSNLNLSWNLGERTTSYRLLLGTDPNNMEILVDWTRSLMNHYNVLGLYNNTVYYWRIDQRNDGCPEGVTGDLWSFTTHLNAPGYLWADHDYMFEGEWNALYWDAPAERGLLSYNVYQDGNVIGNTTETYFDISNLTYNTNGYQFNVTAVYDEGESNYSNSYWVWVSGYGSVEGHVYEQDGVTPIANVTVSFQGYDEFGWYRDVSYYTDDSGYYSGSLYIGNYNVTAYCSGYQQKNYGTVYVPHNENVSGIDFVMDESFTPVAEVVAEYYPDANDPNSPYVKVKWSNNFSGWHTYLESGLDNAYRSNNGNPSWGYEYPVDVISLYAGCNLTKVALFSDDIWGAVGGNFTCNIYLGGNTPEEGTLVSTITVDVPVGIGDWVEYNLIDPVYVTGTETLWVIWHANTTLGYNGGYPAGCASHESLYGDWWNNGQDGWGHMSGSTWTMKNYFSHLSGRDVVLTYNPKVVSNANGTQHNHVIANNFNHLGAPEAAINPNPERVPLKNVETYRSFQYYRVYRTSAYNNGPYNEDNTVLLADNVTDTLLIDVSWLDVEVGSYKYGVSCVYEGNRESEISWGELQQIAPVLNCVSRLQQTPTGKLCGNNRDEIMISEDFENGMPEGWTIIDANNDGYTWCLTSNIPSTWTYYAGMTLDWYHNGSNAICSGSYINGIGALTPDEYLITPQVVLGPGSELSFWVAATDVNYPADHFGVFVSNTGTNPSDFTLVEEWTLTAKKEGKSGIARESRDGNGLRIGSWYNFTVDLSAYTGYAYIAFRHFDCTDQYILAIDDVELSTSSVPIQGPRESAITWSNFLDKDMYLLNNEVSIAIMLNSGDSPEGTMVRFINQNTYEQIHYPVADIVLDSSGYYAWDSFRKGDYQVTITKEGYETVIDYVSIYEPTDLQYQLEETMTNITDLYVSRTGWAKWFDQGFVGSTQGAKNGEDRHLEYYQVICESIDHELIFNTTTPHNFCQIATDGLIEGEHYLCQVAAFYSSGMSLWSEPVEWEYEPCDHWGPVDEVVVYANTEGNRIEWVFENGYNPYGGNKSSLKSDLQPSDVSNEDSAYQLLKGGEFYSQYAEDGLMLNFFALDNVDLRAFLLYNLSNNSRFSLVPEEEYGQFILTSNDANNNFMDEFETAYQNAMVDFSLMSKVDIADRMLTWKSNVVPTNYLSIMMDVITAKTRTENDHCLNSNPFCTSDVIEFESAYSGINADENASFGCLYTTPNPSWYHMRIHTAGQFVIHMEGHDPNDPSIQRDIDYCVWGPFTNPYMPCISDLTTDKIIDCNYSAYYAEDVFMGYPEDEHQHRVGHGTVNYHMPEIGEYYIMMITNYSNQPCNITFTKTEGVGETDCDIINTTGIIGFLITEDDEFVGIAGPDDRDYTVEGEFGEHEYCVRPIYPGEMHLPTQNYGWSMGCPQSASADEEFHWNVDIYQYPYNMSVTGIIQINGVEQQTPVLEIGAFCGDECRGAQRLTYFPQVDRYLVFFTLYGDVGDVMSFRLYDHAAGEELDLSCSSTISFVPDGFMGTAFDPYVFAFGNTMVEQVSNFSEGYNWWGTYIEQEGIDGLGMLQDGLGDNGVTIRSQANGYTDNYPGYGWYGSLTSINNESSYRVITNAPCSVTMIGNAAVPSQHPITLGQGWTWIGYVPSTAMSVDAAMANLDALQGDRLKSQQGYADYYAGYGWFGSLSTMEPGMGLMYYSTNGNPVTFTYPDSGRGGEFRQNLTAENNHWVPNVYAYPDNMTVMAVVELDGVEITSDNYELAAYANGECRGSVKLMYAEPINRHVAFLTISGKDAAELSFRLYDTETGMEYYDAEESCNFVADAIMGEATDLYVIHFKGMTSMNDFTFKVKVYPNPIAQGEHFSIGMDPDIKSPVHVEIVNTLGAVVSVETSTQAPASIVAPVTAGVYTLYITVEGKGTAVRKLVVK